MTENPHCGNAPRILPTTGPNFPDFLIIYHVRQIKKIPANTMLVPYELRLFSLF